jgi:cell division protein FtsL
MSPRAAAAAVARGAASTVHAPTRTRPTRRPAPARRRSGAAARPAARTAVPRFDGVALLDRLLRGPAYIGLVGILLAGIVFFNVDVLELNHGIARTDTRATQLKRENAALTLQLAKLGSSERIQTMALSNGLVLPQPGDVRYLRAHREDAARALRVMTAPDPSSATPAVPALVTQQSGGAATGTPSEGVTPSQTGEATTLAASAPTTTTAGSTPATSPSPAQTAPAATAPSTTTAAPATSTEGGAIAAPATTAQTTP